MLEQIEREIRDLARGRFPNDLVLNFLSTFQNLLGGEKPVDYFLQISTDLGDELELGFFSETYIGDVTLSGGKVYCYTYPLSSIRNTFFTETESKHTLTIQGEKNFDYNVVKPASIQGLEVYKKSLRKITRLGIDLR